MEVKSDFLKQELSIAMIETSKEMDEKFYDISHLIPLIRDAAIDQHIEKLELFTSRMNQNIKDLKCLNSKFLAYKETFHKLDKIDQYGFKSDK